MSDYSFDELVTICAKKGEPIRSLIRVADHVWQISGASRYDPSASSTDTGATPTEALKNLMHQRGLLQRKTSAIADKISNMLPKDISDLL